MSKYLGIILIVLALTLAILPQFADCYSQGKMITLANGNTIPMKCHWTARAELGTGIPLLIIGAMITFSRRRDTIRNLSFAGSILGIMAILLPTILIGVCPTPTMICHTLMLPVLVGLGVMITAVNLVGAAITFKSKEKKLEYSKSRVY